MQSTIIINLPIYQGHYAFLITSYNLTPNTFLSLYLHAFNAVITWFYLKYDYIVVIVDL